MIISLLSPFKGNQNNGIRRRRLDYKSARAILEMAIKKVNSNSMEGFCYKI